MSRQKISVTTDLPERYARMLALIDSDGREVYISAIFETGRGKREFVYTVGHSRENK